MVLADNEAQFCAANPADLADLKAWNYVDFMLARTTDCLDNLLESWHNICVHPLEDRNWQGSRSQQKML